MPNDVLMSTVPKIEVSFFFSAPMMMNQTKCLVNLGFVMVYAIYVINSFCSSFLLPLITRDVERGVGF